MKAMSRANIISACLLLLVCEPVLAGDAVRPDLDAKTLARVRAVVRPASDFSKAEQFELMQGGATTQTERFDHDAFSLPAANLSFSGRSDFSVGNGVFRKLWVAAPSSTTASDGLGPLFNARGCQNCHLKDGRGHPPEPGAAKPAESFILGLSVPGAGAAPEPVYGSQLHDFAVPGLPAEGRVRVTYSERKVELAGGEQASLRVPHYEVVELGYGPMRSDTMISPRVAPQMIGLGLIEAIHDNDLLAKADPDDADGDGISGRVSRTDQVNRYGSNIGRFGVKASKPGIREQSAGAFAADMGLSTPLVNLPHGDCTPAQRACMAAATGAEEAGYEVPQELLDLVEFYSQHLAVPARRDVTDPQVLRGKELFYGIGCISCHTPKYVTTNDKAVPESLRKQLIWPYTDVLLHDMGEGLADHRPQGSADGREWRTPPLWGIGLTQAVSGHSYYLHDGRARNLLEAVLWHGGEAQNARDAVVALAAEDRTALLRFLGSL